MTRLPMARGVRRWLAGGALAALLLPAAAVAQPSSPAFAAESAPAAATQVAGGELRWGVRSSIRNYLETFGHTEGWVAAFEGASYSAKDGFARFPAVAGGTVDAAAGTASVAFTGQLEMYGFDTDWLFFEDVRLEVASGKATVVVDLIESYNVKTRTDDVTLATFDLADDALTVGNDGRVSLTTGKGRFTEDIATRHLPSYGGPTYAAPNDWTDPISLDLSLATTPGGEGPGEPGTPGTPGGTDGEPGDDTGPYGVSTGTPYSDTPATIRVTPGYALNADGESKILVEGFGFDPGPAVAPGTGSGGIYVGFGTMRDQANPETWRRSKGGTSGPIGKGDYTYGAPMFVANQSSADGDVANAMMDANGNWSFTLAVPSGTVPSYFGDTIDCVALQCGVFSFGAHGAVKAQNEAFTPVFFTGQDESAWPDRGDDGGTIVVPGVPDRPTTQPSFPAQGALTAQTRGEVQVLSVSQRSLAVHVGAAHANTWVAAASYSNPRFIDWFLVPANGRITVPVPADVKDGAHSLGIVGSDESLIGWAPFTLSTTPTELRPPAEKEKGKPNGTSTGRNQTSGAELTVSPAKSLADRDQKVTLTGTGYPTSLGGSNFGGVYLVFGWVDKLPSAGGSFANGDYVYADGAGTYQRMVNYPGNTTEPNSPTMDAKGNWTSDFVIYGSKFTSANGVTVDCYKVQCGVFTIGAHGKVNGAGEVFTPVYFDENTEINSGERPEQPAKAPVQPNPNALGGAQQNAGLGVNGGLAALTAGPSDGRTALIAGALLLSFGLFGSALLRSGRGRGGAWAAGDPEPAARPRT